MKTVVVHTKKSRIPDFFTRPIIANRKALRDRGYEVRIVYDFVPNKIECDILLLCSKVYSGDWGEDGRVESYVESCRKVASKLIWCDDSDSSGITHFELFPLIDLYLKKQLLKEKSLYCSEKYYGDRIFTDFYHRQFGITDPQVPFHSKPLELEYQSRVQLSWHIGLGDMYGDIFSRPMKWIRRRMPPSYAFPFHPAGGERPINFSFRGSRKYARPTVSFHREKTGEILDGLDAKPEFQSGKLTRREYIQEMQLSKMVVSPFGWGEIGVRDFECWLNGAALLKPNMDHMDTWPNLFVPGETYQSIEWDFSNLEESVASLSEENRTAVRLAEAGQNAYRDSISKAGQERFCDWFVQQIEL